jgi:hypothetical protein
MESKSRTRYETSPDKEDFHKNKVSFIEKSKIFLKNRFYCQKI